MAEGLILTRDERLVSLYPRNVSMCATARMRRADLLRTGSVVFAALLFAVSYRLWCQDGSLYPQVPLLRLPVALESSLCVVIERVAVVVAILSLGLQLIRKKTLQQSGRVGFLLSAFLLVVMDQHRLQPWLQQLCLLNLFALLLSQRGSTDFAKRLLISIYLFSAASKFDYVFLNTLGQEFGAQLFSFVGLKFEQLPDVVRLAVAWVFPLSELMIGGGLLWRRTRRIAASVAILLHLMLLLILGPLGLKHHWGVLLWNLFFVFQLWVLFLWSPKDLADEDLIQQSNEVPKSAWSGRVCWLLILLPLLEPFHLLDHWPAWQLYAPRNSRVSLSVLEQRVVELPEELRKFVDRGEGAQLWQRFDLDAWSLESVGVPIYPQDRFQLGVSLAIAERFGLEGGVRVEVRSASNRWNGERKRKILRGSSELAEAADRNFKLNAIPRPFRWGSD